MRKRIALRDFIIRATDASRDDVMRCVRDRLGLCLQHSSHVASLVLLVILAVPLLARTNAAVPDPGSTLFEIPSRQYLFGDRGGKRSKLAEKGVTFDFFSISDLEANLSDGMQRTRAGWPRIRGTVDINFARFIEWQGLSFHSTGLWQSGVNLGAKIGTLANQSDLVSAHTTRLDSFWLQQLFFNDKVRLRARQLAGLGFCGNQEYAGSWLIAPWATHWATSSPPHMSRSILPVLLVRRFASRQLETLTSKAQPWLETGTHTSKTRPASIFQIRDTPNLRSPAPVRRESAAD